MSYCLNPDCPNPMDPMNAYGKICRNCGKNLLPKNRYRVLTLLGRGGFAKTFEIDDAGKKKVLKILDLSRFHDPEKKEMAITLFQREAEVLSRLNHPGIPKVEPDGYFQIEFADSSKILHCLVMEKIDGLNLQQWLINRNCKPITPEQARIWLKQLLEILEQVHQKNYFHRDIKPANIMLKPDGQLVLIDFGAVKDLGETLLQLEDNVNGNTLIGSPGYAPPEQMKRKAVTQSDFFALGRTFVYLLTGIHPVNLEDSKTGKLIWLDKVPQNYEGKFDFISQLRWQQFSQLLDKMMAYSWSDRPENTRVILQRLNHTIPLPRFFGYAASTAILFVMGISGIYWYLTGVNGCTKIGLRSFPIGDNISCGEEILMKISTVPEKQQGVDAFAAGNYQLAADLLAKAWQQQQDPETLIYLNNTRLQVGNFQAYTIAVAAPINDNNNDNINTSKEFLRGVAQAQYEFNQKHENKKIGLKVLIVSDHNRIENAEKVAQELGVKNDVLAVVGHFRSDTTLAAIEAYQQQNLLLISPTATSEDLSKVCKPAHPHCFFRVVPSNRVIAKTLARYLKKENKQRAAIFFNPNSNYSTSLQLLMKESFAEVGGEVVAEIPFSENLDTINQLKKKKADVIVLFPTTDGLTSDWAVQVIEYAKQHKYLIVGGDSLESTKILRRIAENETGAVMAVPWHKGINNQEFLTPKSWRQSVNWHTVLAYDATRTLLAALEKLSSPNRMNLRKVMADDNFKATGVTGVISFDRNGDRLEENIHLVQIRKDNEGQLKFVILK